MNKKTKIAIDIDEVLAEFTKLFISYVNKKEPKQVLYHKITSYKLWEAYNIEKKQAYDYANQIDKFIEETEIVKGAKKGIENLKKNFEIHFVTARPTRIKKETINFIKKNFEIKKPNIFFSSDDYHQSNKTSTKGEYCKEKKIKYLIEDNIDFFKNYLDKEITIFLLDKPWNKNISHPKVIRCNHWNEIINKINKLEQKKCD